MWAIEALVEGQRRNAAAGWTVLTCFHLVRVSSCGCFDGQWSVLPRQRLQGV
jgi:hypothetical protein